MGEGDQEQGRRARDAAVGRRPGALAQDAQRSQPHAGADRHDRRLGGRRRAKGQRRRPAADAEVRRGLDVRARAGRDPRDARGLHDPRGRGARRADVLLEGAVERGSVRRDARDSSRQPRGRAPRRRVRRRHSRGREDRQRPPRDAGREGVDRSRRRRRRTRGRHRAAGREQAAVVGAGPRRRFAPRRHRQADSRRQVHQLADSLQPDRQGNDRSHAPRHLVQQGAGDARTADSPGGRCARHDQGRPLPVSRRGQGSRVHRRRRQHAAPEQDAEHPARTRRTGR